MNLPTKKTSTNFKFATANAGQPLVVPLDYRISLIAYIWQKKVLLSLCKWRPAIHRHWFLYTEVGSPNHHGALQPKVSQWPWAGNRWPLHGCVRCSRKRLQAPWADLKRCLRTSGWLIQAAVVLDQVLNGLLGQDRRGQCLDDDIRQGMVASRINGLWAALRRNKVGRRWLLNKLEEEMVARVEVMHWVFEQQR